MKKDEIKVGDKVRFLVDIIDIETPDGYLAKIGDIGKVIDIRDDQFYKYHIHVNSQVNVHEFEIEKSMKQDIKILAGRAYPGLKRSGFCSFHREDGYYDCQTCYPDYHKLLEQQVKVSQQLYDELLELSGLSDPANGRIGTNAIIEQLIKKLGK